MIAGLILLVVIVGVTTTLLARKAKREARTAPLWTIVAINGVGAALTISIVGAGWFAVQKYRYDRCVSTAESRNAYRDGQVALFDAIDAFTGSQRFTHDSFGTDPETGEPLPSLRAGLDIRSPQLDPHDCQKI